ncbi:MAG: sugar ABC transporter permease [Streptosporangiaceae bacterium]
MASTQHGTGDSAADTVAAPDQPQNGDVAADRAAMTAAPDVLANSIGEYARIWWQRARNGESGALPVILGLVAIVLFFQIRNSLFLSAGNLVNLMILAATFIILGMAEIWVLLLGEIDLSAGYNAAIGATVVFWAAYTLPWWVAIIIGLAVTAFIGLVQGLFITLLGLPSFVVTLAGLLFLEGLQIILTADTGHGAGGSISNPSNIINDFTAGNLSPAAAWIVMVVLVALAGLIMFQRDRRRRANGLVAPPVSVTMLKVAAMAVAGVAVVIVGNLNRSVGLTPLRGVPWAVLIVLGVVVLYTVITGRTRYGRYLYAIGGNAEAARRAGVNLMRIRTLAFVMCGLTAGIGGIMLGSQLNSMGTTENGGQYVLFAVAAAVIGGTNLFGGRGRMLNAVLGGLVVAVIDNGLALIGMSAAATDMVTAIVLLAAVTIDTLARRSRSTV